MTPIQFTMTPERIAAFRPRRSLWTGPRGTIGQFPIIQTLDGFALRLGPYLIAYEGHVMAWMDDLGAVFPIK